MRRDDLKGNPWWHPKTILYCMLVIGGALLSVFTIIMTIWPTEDYTPTTSGSLDKNQKRKQKKKTSST